MKKFLHGAVLSGVLFLLGGCFQAQLNGPVSGASITVSDLRDPAIVYPTVHADNREDLLALHGPEKWDGFGAVGRLWLLGVFRLNVAQLQDDRLYLVTASGGEDADVNLDAEEDDNYSPVLGNWRAIMTGAQLKSVGPKVTALTEAAYLWLQSDLATLSDTQVLYNLDLAARGVVADVNSDGEVGGLDLLSWSRLFDGSKLIADVNVLNLISNSLRADTSASDRLAWSQQLVGREVSRAVPPGASPLEALAIELQGLSLDDFFDVSYRHLLSRTPESIVELGLPERYPLDSIGLDNIADAWEQDTFAMAGVILAALLEYDRAAFSAADQVSYDVYKWYLENRVESARYHLYSYPASSFITGVPSSTQFFFSDIHPLETTQDIRDYLARLRLVDDKFSQLRDKVAARAAAGVIEPAITLEWAIDALESVADAPATSTNYFVRFLTALDNNPDLSDTQRANMRRAARLVVNEEIQPAYAALIADLRSLRSRAPQAIGVGQFAGGADFYAWALRSRTTTTMTPAQVHQLGLDELERLQQEIETAALALGYPAGLSLVDLYERVASDSGGLTGSDILRTYEDIVALASQRLPRAFDTLPQQEVVVIGGPTGGFYVAGSEDGSRPGAFYAATTGQESRYSMPSLAYHEAVPGHHLQIALAQEQALPDFRRYTNYTAFVEGWALYAERLAFELGWYEGDPYGNLGRLQFEAIRATRLVVDTGIHAYGWSWNKAVSFYHENTGESLYYSQGAVGRFMRWPAQATAYMVGMNKFLELRARMQEQRGDDYDLRDFHTRVLSGAAMPFSILEHSLDESSASD
jgi:uncharacterized protein (DUF885 family)